MSSFLFSCKKHPVEPASPCTLATLAFSKQTSAASGLDARVATTLDQSGTLNMGLTYANNLVTYKGRYNYNSDGLPISFDEIDSAGNVRQQNLAQFTYEKDQAGQYRLKTYRQVSYFNRDLVDADWSFTYDSSGTIQYVHDRQRSFWYNLVTDRNGDVVNTRYTTWTDNVPSYERIPSATTTYTTKDNPFVIIPLAIRLHLFYLVQYAYYHTTLNFEQILSRHLIDTYTMGDPAYTPPEQFTHTATESRSSVDNIRSKGEFLLEYNFRCP